ncbi:MAG: homogentisate phytyltransferase [Mastigocoleus sp.]
MSQVKAITPPRNWLYAFWKFSRPHTIFGTSLSVLGLYTIASSIISVPNSSLPVLGQLFGTLIACLCGNIYIVGLNQLQDIAIDKINKPHLPLASGEFSRRTGRLIVAITGVLALVISWFLGPFLFGMVFISVAIGTAYSLPPIRLKRFPFWAALCIFSVRGTIVNLGLFLHFSWVLKQLQSVPPPVWALTWFILVYTFAIAILKDVPDAPGDMQYNISTFTIRLGKETVFNLARGVLSVCYAGMILIGLLGISFLNPGFLIISHLMALSLLWFYSQKVDLNDQDSITSFYQFIWKLFFVEYFIFPIACILG